MRKLMDFNHYKLVNESVGSSVRVRFAPSPTGPLHIGGVRTALYNYLFAKKHNGKFILRIEDTDSTRFVPGAEQYIIDSFDWLGLKFDEGPHVGGPYGPYRQSERKDIYRKYAQQLVDNNLAYYAFDTPDELENARNTDKHFAYDFNSRKSMRNSLTLPKDEVDNLLENTNNWTIRIKYPDNPKTLVINDIIRGVVRVKSDTLDDKVIWKSSDQLPTYHLANIVDDHLMKISHVIRGEEWLPSAPLHVYLYECFGWESPIFAHLPLILKPQGNGKLSKRDGDMLGFPVFPLAWTDPNGDDKKSSTGYKSEGYRPEALINILAFLGWNPGTDKEIYSLDELVQDFSLDRVNKSGARFNPAKAKWFNAQYLKITPTIDLLDEFKQDLEDRGIEKSNDFIYNVLDKYKGKVDFVKNLYDEVRYLFEKPTDFDNKSMKKWKQGSDKIISDFVDELKTINDWSIDNIQMTFDKYANDYKVNFNILNSLLRILLTGKASGPFPIEIMEIIGKDDTIDRLTNYKLPNTGNIPQPISDDDNVDGRTKQRIEQLSAELDGVQRSLSSTEKKLANPNFVERAPSNVVENERTKKTDLELKIFNIKKELEELQA